MYKFIKFTGILVGLLTIALVGFVGLQLHSGFPNVLSGWNGNAVEYQHPQADQTATQAISTSTPSDNKTQNIVTASPLAHKADTTSPATSRSSAPAEEMGGGISKTNISTPAPIIITKNDADPVPQTEVPETVVKIVTVPTQEGVLSEAEIIRMVNEERAKQGLAPLKYNATLSAMARVKAEDMIAKHYFAHVAPDGTDVSKLAERFNYAYLTIGENLAMGDFTSSKEVMDGWMNSPGHRANILKTTYAEIGVSAIEGEYEGRMVWFAVQEFGRPLSDCPFPDAELEQTISENEATLATLKQQLTTLLAEMESPHITTDAYNAKVEEYNTILDKYNALVVTTKSNITTYNEAVDAFNACVGT